MVEKLAYTIREACDVSGSGRSSIYKEIGAGRLPAHKLGNRTLILAQDLENFLNSLPTIKVRASCEVAGIKHCEPSPENFKADDSVPSQSIRKERREP